MKVFENDFILFLLNKIEFFQLKNDADVFPIQLPQHMIVIDDPENPVSEFLIIRWSQVKISNQQNIILFQ